MTEPQILEGDLRDVHLPQVLKTLAFQQATGILTVQGEDDIVAVSLLNGHIVTADSLNQTQEESLGELLVEEDLVSKGDFEAVVLEGQSSGSATGELLVSRGLVRREKLLECLRLQTYRLMLQILTWRRGEFKFYGGDEVSYEKGVTPISVEETLVRALTDLGEASGIGGEVPKLDGVYRKVPPRGPVQVLGRDGSGGPGIWITELQQAFLDRLDGRTTAYDAARSVGAGRFRTLFSLHQLIQNDLIELASADKAAASAVSPPPDMAGLEEDAGLLLTSPALVPDPDAAAPADGAAPGDFVAAGEKVLERTAPQSSSTIFRPPLFEEDRPSVAASPGTPRAWVGPALAAVLLASMVVTLLTRPSSYLLPFPWQQDQRSTVERQMRQALFLKIDRAIGTFYLMDFQYPRNLDLLVKRSLLAASDKRDPAGQSLRFSVKEQSFQIDLVGDGSVESRSGSISGDFILDPDLFTEDKVKNPLVLLD